MRHATPGLWPEPDTTPVKRPADSSPWRLRVWSCGYCNTRDKSILAPGGLCASCRRQPPLFAGTGVEPELTSEAVYRTARKPWQCECDGSCGELIRNESRRSRCVNRYCAGVIAPGDRYVEYLGETPAYQSGSRYCLICGIAAWNAARRADHDKSRGC